MLTKPCHRWDELYKGEWEKFNFGIFSSCSLARSVCSSCPEFPLVFYRSLKAELWKVLSLIGVRVSENSHMRTTLSLYLS